MRHVTCQCQTEIMLVMMMMMMMMMTKPPLAALHQTTALYARFISLLFYSYCEGSFTKNNKIVQQKFYETHFCSNYSRNQWWLFKVSRKRLVTHRSSIKCSEQLLPLLWKLRYLLRLIDGYRTAHKWADNTLGLPNIHHYVRTPQRDAT